MSQTLDGSNQWPSNSWKPSATLWSTLTIILSTFIITYLIFWYLNSPVKALTGSFNRLDHLRKSEEFLIFSEYSVLYILCIQLLLQLLACDNLLAAVYNVYIWFICWFSESTNFKSTQTHSKDLFLEAQQQETFLIYKRRRLFLCRVLCVRDDEVCWCMRVCYKDSRIFQCHWLN